MPHPVRRLPPHRPTPNFTPSWNLAPTDPLPVVRYDTKGGEGSLDLLREGLVPFWAKDVKVGCTAVTIERSINAAEQPAIVAARQSRSVASAGQRSLSIGKSARPSPEQVYCNSCSDQTYSRPWR
jgi:putative SOS response-associated peptidase YedK